MTAGTAAGPAPARGAGAGAGGHRAGSGDYRRLNLALWCAGAGTFMLVYAVQALLPAFSAAFALSPAASSLSLSAATGTLALAIIPVSSLAESWGRRRMMTLSLAGTALLGLLAPLAPTFPVLLVIRAAQGVVMAGVPALAMAYLAAEVDRRDLGRAMGVLIAGNTMGGLSGRLAAALLADLAGWRVALLGVGVLALGCLVAFRLLLPPPRHDRPPRLATRQLGLRLGRLLADPGVRGACAIAFLLMSAFVTVYNYLGFRLLGPPFELPVAVVGLVFLGYLAGTASSTAAGALGDRVGALPVLLLSGLLALAAAVASLVDLLPLVLVSLVVFTAGFFGAHATASGWLNARAGTAPGQASALYLFSYYAGSSIGGAVGGVAYGAAGWPGVVAYVATLLAVACGCAVRLRRLPVS
jgi:YNFM family putative membrane transporter